MTRASTAVAIARIPRRLGALLNESQPTRASLQITHQWPSVGQSTPD
ncbi:hypothetical protein JJD41_16470 [Oxynema sp. CENA135]|nr:hypothetical protein [Oxynema sp. CENA135]MBK4731446.1 hypothetical protein [Oxynema sp. CENA135]